MRLGRRRHAGLDHPRQGEADQGGARQHDDRLRAAELGGGRQEVAHLLVAQVARQAVDLLPGTAHIVGDGGRIGGDGVGKCLRRTRNARDRVGAGRLGTVRDVLGLGADRIADSAADAFCLLLDLFRDAAEPLVVPRVGA